MGSKYFCWNIDDGLEQDKRIVEVLRKNGMGATFNLNSGMLGKKQMIGRVGNYGIKDVPIEKYRHGFHLMKYHENFRIPADEVKQVYEGFEIASHGYLHENLQKIPQEKADESICKDVQELSKLFGTEIKGFAYPYGAYNDQTTDSFKKAGIRYARTVSKAENFYKPMDLFHMPITGWHLDKDIMVKLEHFINAVDEEKDLFFLMFAHGYEFDFNTPDSNWEKFKAICDKVAGREDIICCSTAEALGV